MYTEKHALVKTIFTNGINLGLLPQAWVEKIVHEVETHWLSCKEKVSVVAVRKESDADSVPGYEMTYHYWFLWKRHNYKRCFLLPTPEENLTLFIEWPSYIEKGVLFFFFFFW